MADSKPAALVTGARRGIGRGIAVALAARGFNVVVNDAVADGLEQETLTACRAHGVAAQFVQADIADLAGHADLIARAWDAFGGLECLVNNAGVQMKVRGDLLDTDVADYDRLMSINLRGPFFLTCALAKRMLAESKRGPRSIVNISSANAWLPAPDRAAYALTKTGVSMMTKMFALRLADHGVMVHEIRPGIIRTDMTAVVREKYTGLIANGVSPICRWGETDDVGRTVAALAAADLPFTTGDAYHVDGGLHLAKL
jgi:NAD(P)-dependent dehydrogenase (short-subunit alcohol dehydrogenase family)